MRFCVQLAYTPFKSHCLLCLFITVGICLLVFRSRTPSLLAHHCAICDISCSSLAAFHKHQSSRQHSNSLQRYHKAEAIAKQGQKQKRKAQQSVSHGILRQDRDMHRRVSQRGAGNGVATAAASFSSSSPASQAWNGSAGVQSSVSSSSTSRHAQHNPHQRHASGANTEPLQPRSGEASSTATAADRLLSRLLQGQVDSPDSRQQVSSMFTLLWR